MLLFLGFNEASHGGYNLERCPLESPSIRLYVIISILDIFSHGILNMHNYMMPELNMYAACPNIPSVTISIRNMT